MRGFQGMALAATALVAGCGGGSADKAGAAAEVSSNWGADACKTLPAGAAGKAVGLQIAKATVSTTRVGDNTVSTCSYTAADSTPFTVALRHAPDGTMNEAIAGLKANPDMTGPMEEVNTAKGKAFWAPKLKTLTYIPDDRRMVSVTPPGASVMGGHSDPDDLLKQRAQTLAEAAAS